MLDFSEDVTPEATAYVAKFLAHQHKDSPLLPKAAQWLMNHRNEGYWWSSTKQTAMVIYGLIDYLKTTNELKPNLTATVLVNDKPVLTRKIDQATSLNVPELVLDESKLAAGSQSHSRDWQPVRGGSTIRRAPNIIRREQRFQKTGTVSLNLLRDYFRLAPTKNGDKIVYDTAPLDWTRRAGRYHRGAAHGDRIGVEIPDARRSDSGRARSSSSATTCTSCAIARRGGPTSSRAASCTTIAWRFSRPIFRGASSSISTC